MANSPYVIDVTLENFQAVVLEGSLQRPVLVDFWADWCAPCRALGPLLDSIAEQMGGQLLVAKINTEEQQDLAAQFGIRSLPTVKLFKDGQLVDEFMGALPEQEIKDFLAKHIDRASDRLLAEAQDMLANGQLEAARARIEQVRASDPENSRIGLLSAQMEAAAGQFEAAEATLNSLPLDQQNEPEIKSLRAQLAFDKTTSEAPDPLTLKALLSAEPNNSEARFQLATHLIKAQDYESALDELLTLLRKDRQYGDDAARKTMLQIFDLLGGSGELVSRYRSKLTNALF